MAYTEQQVRDTINAIESKYPELPKGTLLKMHGIETAGDASKINVRGGESKSPAGAKGWFQFIDTTAKMYNVDPSNLESAADGAARLMRDNLKQYKGNMDHALAAYNGGGNAVRALASGKPWAETAGYLQKFHGQRNAAPNQVLAAQQADIPLSPYQKAQLAMRRAGQQFAATKAPEARSIDTTLDTINAATEASQTTMAAEQETVGFGEAVGYGVTQTLTEALHTMARPADPNWKYGDDQFKQASELGAVNDERIMSYLEGADSQDDFDERLVLARAWMDTERKMQNETGIAWLGTQGAVMLGSMADPVSAVVSLGVGAGLARAGLVAQTAARRAAAGVAEGFVSNAVTDAVIQAGTNSQVNANDVIQQGIVGAVFSVAGTVARASAHVLRTAHEVSKVDALAGAQHAEVAADIEVASQPINELVTKNVDRSVNPDKYPAPDQELPNAFNTTKLQGLGEAARGQDNPVVRHIQTQKQGTLGLTISAEAAELTRRANGWSEDVGVAGQTMQDRLTGYYQKRDALIKAGHADGAVKAVDSIGLTLAKSESKVVRYLGSHLVESGTGLGRREISVAVAADQLNMNLQHRYVPTMISQMIKAMTPAEKAGFYSGWGVEGQNRIGREVAVFREARRQAIRSGQDMDKWSFDVTPEVKAIADSLDAMNRDVRNMMADAGHPDAGLMYGNLADGFRQYEWNWRKLQSLDAPELNAFTRAIQSEFREQLIAPALAEYRDGGGLQRDLDAYRSNLETNVAELQRQIKELESELKTEEPKQVGESTKAEEPAKPADQPPAEDAWDDIGAWEPDDTSPENVNMNDPLSDQEMARRVAMSGMGNQIGGMRASDALESIANNQDLEPAHRKLAMWLMSDGMKDVELNFFDGQGATRKNAGMYYTAADMVVMQVEGKRAQAKFKNAADAKYAIASLEAYDQEIVLHEIVHARTSRLLSGVASGGITDPDIVAAAKRITELRQYMIKHYKGPDKRKTGQGIGYALQNDHEFVAQIMNSRKARAAMHSVKLDGVPLWNKFVKAVAELLGFGDGSRSVLTDTLSALDGLLQLKGEFSSGNQRLFAPEATPKAKQLQTRKNTLARYEADLSSLNDVGGEAKKMSELYNSVEKKWLEKANNKASYYVRTIMQDPESRARGSQMHLVDIAADLLKEEHEGNILTGEGIDTFAETLGEIIKDRSRREMNLLRPVGDGLMLDYLSNNDPVGLAKNAASSFSRKAAMSKFAGIQSEFDELGAMEAARMDGATPEEMEALRDTFDLLQGRRDQQMPEAVQALKDFAHAAYMGGQGFTTAADMTNAFGALGAAGGIKAFGTFMRNVVYTPEGTKLAMQLTDIAAGTMGNDYRLNYVLPESAVMGMVDADDSSRVRRTGKRSAQAVGHLSLANRVNSAAHKAFTPYFAEHLVKQVQTVSDDARLTDLGLSPEWIERVRAQMDKHDLGRKKGNRINFDAWDDQAAADRFVAAIHRGVFQTLQKGLVGEKPAWVELTTVGQLVGQFRSFGMIAAEKQLVRSMGLGDSNAVLQAGLGLIWGGMLYYLRAMAQSAGMSDRERREHMNRRLEGANMVSGVMNFWNMSGLAPDMLSAGKALFGGTTSSGTGIVALDYAQQVSKAPGRAMEGDWKAATVLPGGNLIPILGVLNLLNE